MQLIKNWFSDRSYDIYFWWKDQPFKKIWRGIKDRVDAVIFCLMLLVVGIYSPKTLRRLMLDSLNNTK